MSIMVQAENGDIIMFSKGADSSMLQRCRLDDQKRKKLQERVDKMAAKCYRTLVLGMRRFDSDILSKLENFKKIQRNVNSPEEMEDL